MHMICIYIYLFIYMIILYFYSTRLHGYASFVGGSDFYSNPLLWPFPKIKQVTCTVAIPLPFKHS